MNTFKTIFTIVAIMAITTVSAQVQLPVREKQTPAYPGREAATPNKMNSQQQGIKQPDKAFDAQKQGTVSYWESVTRKQPAAETRETVSSVGKNNQSPLRKEEKKQPLQLDLSSLSGQQGKTRKENSSFTYIPITLLPYTANDTLTASSQVITTLQPGGSIGHYAVGYSLFLNQGDYLDIMLYGNFDTYLYLLDANYNILAYDDDGGINNGSLIDRIIPQTGTYYIIATSYGNYRTGAFTLNVSKSITPKKTFYVDATTGSDTNNGQAPSTPLASLTKAMDLLNQAPSMGTVYLMSDIELDQTLDIDYYVSLKNHTASSVVISRNTATCQYEMIDISQGGILVIGDPAAPANALTLDGGSQLPFTAYGEIIYNEGSFIMYGGATLQNNHNQYDAGAVYNDYGASMYMYGGNIINNSTDDDGGGIYNDGTFVMYNGTLSGNNAQDDGNDLYSETGLVLNGGMIHDMYLGDGMITLGTAYTDTQTKRLNLAYYRGGMQVLSGNLNTAVINSFRLAKSNWNIDAQGKLEFTGTPLEVYVSNTGNDADAGTVSEPFATLEQAVDMLNSLDTVGAIYVMSDLQITSSSGLSIYTNIAIRSYDANAYTVSRDTTTCKSSMIQVYGTLSLGESQAPGGLVWDGGYDSTSPTPFIARESIINIYGGIVYLYDNILLRNNNTTGNWSGAGIYLSGGILNMQGGAIAGNIAQSAGGIYNKAGTVVMNGGKISHNKATDNGGGIYNGEAAVFSINAGSIDSNYSQYGGGIYNNNATCTMSGGSISTNGAEQGGGIYNENAKVIMSNGSIKHNTAQEVGAGVYNTQQASFTLSGGNIDSNVAINAGGGLLNTDDAIFTMNGGRMNGNKAAIGGAIGNDATLIVNNGSITGNDSVQVVHVGGEFLLNGGTIDAHNSILLIQDAIVTIGSTYINTAVKGLGLENYYRGKQVLDGNLATNIRNSFQLARPHWSIDNLGRLAFDSPMALYVSNTGDDANAGTVSSPLATLEQAVGMLNSLDTVGVIYVMSDLLLGYALEIYSDITILPYGSNTYTVLRDINNVTEIMIEIYEYLTLGDNTTTGQLIFDGGYDTVTNPGVFSGDCLIFNEGTLVLYDGITLQNNVFDLSWGFRGGCIWNNVKMIMYGGKISRNQASSGAGIYNNGSITMNGGEISHNHAQYGGGIYNNADISMNAGNIDSNDAQSGGGGIYNSNTTCTMSGGSISGNKSEYGAGIYNFYAAFTLYDGMINNNISREDGAAAHSEYADFIMYGGRIENNVAGGCGGAVNNYSGEFMMTNGSIKNNRAAKAGSGIFSVWGATTALRGNINFAGNDIALGETSGNPSFINMLGAITTPQPILLTPMTHDATPDTFFVDPRPCRVVVSNNYDYVFKGEDILAFTLPANITDTVLAFNSSNDAITIYEAPDSANDTTVVSCGVYIFNDIRYNGNNVAYEYAPGAPCEELARRVIITADPLMESSISAITGPAAITSSSTYTYSVENVPGAVYAWSITGASWRISGSGSSITLNVDSKATAVLKVTVTGQCDVATRTLTITSDFVNIEDYAAENNILVYPNPATDYVDVRVLDIPTDNPSIHVYNIMGGLIKQQAITDKVTRIDLSNLATGIYILKVGNRTFKVAKQ